MPDMNAENRPPDRSPQTMSSFLNRLLDDLSHGIDEASELIAENMADADDRVRTNLLRALKISLSKAASDVSEAAAIAHRLQV